MPAPAGEREEAFAAWRTFFERVAVQGTAVLVFDDLQHADQGLLDFIERVAEHAAGYPILLVAVARPELFDRRPGWGAGVRDHVDLHLEPLPRAAMATLLSGLAPGLPAEVSERILDRAGGMPLYAVEILRMLLDRGELAVSGGIYRVRSSLDRLSVPETLQALIAARIDGLEPRDRAVLRDAAVLGQAFPSAAVAAVGDSTVEATEPRLRQLVRRELLTAESLGARRRPGQVPLRRLARPGGRLRHTGAP